ncbi:acyl-CoA/acyl-ACP dehydrogenase [Ruminiclostridium herbifermentans]|uniref:Acyl-CoA/acyl-ACP dehydrogenase n=1 Tax=Ruminiclostridium herbifermentans TaxID=2488810 RepID=A0A4U7JHS6_9FIRM|nr:acyl-CoA dehydrogenase family protein [Ruminiclostridium herbifermentans]QNU66251.1 acyl-CoA/acyl-ACP dehydrogenase [Ruminiclostridium herbifermentans]
MYLFNDFQNEIKESIDDFILNVIEKQNSNDINKKTFLYEVLEQLGSLGYKGLMVSEEFGGVGLDAVSALLIISRIAYSDPSLAHVLETINFGFCYPIYLLGTQEQKELFLSNTLRENYIGTLAVNEPEKEIKTIAHKDGDYYILNGIKNMITCAGTAQYALVNALVDNNNTFFIVDLKNTDGIVIGKTEETMGLESMAVSEIYLEDAKVHKDNILLGIGKGLEVILKSMELMRICNSAVALGIAQRAFNEAVEYSKVRIINGQPLFEMQSVKYDLAEIKANLEMMETLVYYTGNIYSENVEGKILHSSISKLIVTEKAKEICDKCLQYFGGYGYVKGVKVEKLYRDIRIMTILGGVSEVMKWSISRFI